MTDVNDEDVFSFTGNNHQMEGIQSDGLESSLQTELIIKEEYTETPFCLSESEPHNKFISKDDYYVGKLSLAQDGIYTQGMPLSCSLCHLKCKSPSALKIHERKHTGEKPYSCSQCNKTFATKGTLKTHETIHLDEGAHQRKFSCSKCDKKFKKLDHLNKHMLFHIGKRSYRCFNCDKKFIQASDLKKHEMVHTGERPYKCQKCYKSYTSRRNLRNHEKSCHRKINIKLQKLISQEKNLDGNQFCSEATILLTQVDHLKKHESLHTLKDTESNARVNQYDEHNQSTSRQIEETEGNEKEMAIIEGLNDTDNCHEKYEAVETSLNTSNKMMFSCSICDQTFSKEHFVAAHMWMRHENEKVKLLNCFHCNFKCESQSALRIHERTHTGDKPYSCLQCNKNFETKSNLKTHKWIHRSEETGERPYSCFTCNKKFRRLDYLKKHKLLHTGEKPYDCCHCDKKFRTATHLKQHVRVHTNEHPYKCLICNKRYKNSSNLRSHEKRCQKEMNTKVKNLTIREKIHGGYQFWSSKTQKNILLTQEANLKEHSLENNESIARYNLNDKQNQSNFRQLDDTEDIEKGMDFKEGVHVMENYPEDDYSKVVETSFDKSNKIMFGCSLCDQQFSKEHFAAHILLRHENEKIQENSKIKSVTCIYCDYKCINQSALKIHERKHTGDKPYSCLQCDKNFATKGNLKTHGLIHRSEETGERPYSCFTCNKRFIRQDYLKKHELLHTGEKPYGCSLCDKKFTQATHLKQHERVHTNERPYMCLVCDKSFYSSSSLRDHERSCQKHKKSFQPVLKDEPL